MTEVEKKICNLKYYKNLFAGWEAEEHIISDTKALYILQKPGSRMEKICMFRDDNTLFIYGDYGQFSFDNMTWLATPSNLPYNNLGYLTEKMGAEQKKSIMIYHEDACREDILDWLRGRLEERFDINDEVISKLLRYFVNTPYIIELCKKYDVAGLEDILYFTRNALDNIDKYEWISFLRSNCDMLDKFEEAGESDLWNAGQRINPKFYINLYALQVLGEKLEKQKIALQEDFDRE
jgi:hypothetical protein